MSLLIGITQRVVIEPSRRERRDALDQAWVSFLYATGIEMIAISNRHPDPVSFVKHIGIKGLILSGGNDVSRGVTGIHREAVCGLPLINDVALERDMTEIRLLEESVRQGWPVLGVCRGTQIINVFYGGKLSSVDGHAAGSHHVEITEERWHEHAHVPPDNIVNSYHNYGILEQDLAPPLQVWAEATDGTVEALMHTKLPHYGIMWHPERYLEPKESDRELFRYVFQK